MDPTRARTLHPGAIAQPRVAQRITLGDWRTFLHWQWLVAFAFVAAVGIFVPTVKPVVVLSTADGGSMEPTLRDGSRAIFVGWRGIVPKEGGIYSFSDNSGVRCIKRATKVVGTKVWLLGDNLGTDPKTGQPTSIDSRSYGWVSVDKVHATLLLRLPTWCDGVSSKREAAMPLPGSRKTTKLDLAVDSAGARVKESRDRWLMSNCERLDVNVAKLTGGHLDKGAIVAEKADMEISFDFGRKAKIEEVEVQPPGEFWSFVVEPSIGSLVPGTSGRFRPAGLETQKLVVKATGCLGGPPGGSARIDALTVWIKR